MDRICAGLRSTRKRFDASGPSIRSAPHELTNRANSNDVHPSQLCDHALFPGRGSRRRPISTPQGNCSCGTEYCAQRALRSEGRRRRAARVQQQSTPTETRWHTACLSKKRYEPLGSASHSQPGASLSLSCALWGGCRGHSIADGRVEAVTSTHKRIRPVEGRLDRVPHHPPPHDAGARPYNTCTY